MECTICFDNKENLIMCTSCKNNICKSCICKWFENSYKFNCPCCDIKWTSYFIYTKINKKFDELYEKMKPLLLEKEKSYIPYTQHYCNAYKCLIKLVSLSNINLEDNDNLKDDISYINHVIEEENYNEMKSIKYDHHKSFYIVDSSHISYKSNINKICKCFNIECKGYIMSNDYKCGMCNMEICNKCHCIYIPGHKCNENEIESIKLIDSDTKPCPVCFVRIHKYEGCDQAYCTQCRTAFSYNTGKIERGRIHNPHYYEQMEKLNMNIDCENEDPGFFIYSQKRSDDVVNLIKIYNVIHRYYVHNVGILENKYNSKNHDEILDDDKKELDFYTNIRNRIIYIVGSDYMTDNDFTHEIYIKYKLSIFYEDIYCLMSEYLNIFRIILRNMKKYLTIDYESKSIVNLSIFKNLFDLLKNEISLYYKNKLYDICNYFEIEDNKTFKDFNFLENDNFLFVNIEYNH